MCSKLIFALFLSWLITDTDAFLNIFKKSVVVKYYLYTNANPDEPQIINDENSILVSNYDPALQTKFIVHGWLSLYLKTPNRPIREAYLATGKYNIISVDWSSISFLDYITAVNKVPEVGKELARFIDFLNEKFELKFNEIVLIGHSLGAHVVGYAGKNVKRGTIESIIGIDAAAPLYDYNDLSSRLAYTDANYVVSIHASDLGIFHPIGHASYYPNGGHDLESCTIDILDICSHNRANLIYSAAVRGTSFAPIYQCASFDEIDKQTGCNIEVDAPLGDPLITGKRPAGIFYFRAKDTSILATFF